MDFLISALAGTATGILTGFGVGGGTLLILYMQMFTDIAQASAQGINLAYFLPTASGALIGHIRERRVVWRAVIIAGGAGVIIGAVTSLFTGRLDDGVLRKIFGAFLIFVGISEVFCRKKKQ